MFHYQEGEGKENQPSPAGKGTDTGLFKGIKSLIPAPPLAENMERLQFWNYVIWMLFETRMNKAWQIQK